MGSLWNRSGTIERYADDLPAAGAQAYFFEGGTLQGLTVYSDAAEGEAHTFPLLADARGRWPDVFIPYNDTGFDVQVKTADGVQLTYTRSVPNPNPVDVTAPPVTDGLQTGMIHAELVNSTKAGFVRLNGRTIGNASSSATERANADTVSLFTYLWNNLSNTLAPVSGGRGASAAADYAANKAIVVPSARGAALVGLDDMGNSAGGFFTAQSFAAGNSAILAGSACGGNSRTLSVGNLPSHSHTASSATAGGHTPTGTIGNESAHTHTGTTGIESSNHSHSGTTGIENQTHTHSTPYNGVGIGTAGTVLSSSTAGVAGNITTSTQSANHTHNFTSSTQSANHTHDITTNAGSAHTHSLTMNAVAAHSHTITVDSTGSGTAVDNMPSSVLVTWYIKL